VIRSFSLFLALRYLKPKRSFVSVITVISILGVTLGIAVMIVVISVMQGFDDQLQETVLGFEPEIQIQSDGPIDDWRPIITQLEKTPGVHAAPEVHGPVIAEHEHIVNTPLLVGIDPAAEARVVNLKPLIKEGDYKLTGNSVIVGVTLADDLQLRLGDKITITGPGNLRKILEEVQKAGSDPNSQEKLSDLKDEVVMPADLTVTGIFETGEYDYDDKVLFVSLSIGQELYGLEDAVHSIAVRTPDPYISTTQIAQSLNSTLHPPEYAETWMERHQDRFDAVRLERSVMFFILMVIVIVAAFGVMTTLITVTVQKTREIGIMKALGATTSQITWVFMMHGMVVGVFGNLTGYLLGIGAVRYRNDFRAWLSGVLHEKVFPGDVYGFSLIPARIIPQDVAIICVSAFILCTLAAFLPAYFAARLDPVEALRHE
jgi:lipoprotein-releasing system permease protein